MAKKIVAPASPTITISRDELAALVNPAKSIEARRALARLDDARYEVEEMKAAIHALGLTLEGCCDGFDASHARGIGTTLRLLCERPIRAFNEVAEAA